MNRLIASRIVLGLAILLLARPVPAETAANGQPDLAGEQCRVVERPDILPDPAAPPPEGLRCAGQSRESGALSLMPLPLTLPADRDKRREVLERTAAVSPAGLDAASRMSCPPGQWLDPAGKGEFLVRNCALIDGNWPVLQIIAPVGPWLVQAEGLPVLLPVLEAEIARLAPTLAPAEILGGTGNISAILNAAYDNKPPLVAARDVDRFAQLTEQARLQNTRTDYRGSEEAYRQALLIEEKAQGPDSAGVGSILLELALEVSNQGRFEEAAALFRRADPIIVRSPNPSDQARYFSYLADDAANAGRYADALAYARQATATWRELLDKGGPNLENLGGGDEGNLAFKGNLAYSLNIQAVMALKTGDLAEAESSAKEALDIIGQNQSLPPWWRPEILVTIGRVYAALGRLNEAEESFKGALIFQQRLFGETAPTAQTLLALSGVYAAQGLYADSLRAFDVAMKILEADDLARSHVTFDQVAPALVAANALSERNPDRRAEYQEKMFHILQLVSAGIADQTITQASVRLAAGDPAIEEMVRGLQESERQRDLARIELAYQTSLPDEDRGSIKENQLMQEINRQATTHAVLLEEIEKKYPSYAELIHPRPLTLDRLQARLQPHEGLVLFTVGRAKAFATVIGRDVFLSRPIDTDEARLADAVRELRKPFELRGGKVGSFDLGESYALYRTLFGPVEKALSGMDRLVVVANGPLASLPVALLVTAKPGAEGDYRHAAWLARRYASTQLPTIRAFAALRSRPTAAAASLPFLGIGNPAFTGQSGPQARPGGAMAAITGQCREGAPVPASLLKALDPLPETAGELRDVAKSLGAGEDSLLLGPAATETALRKLPLDKARILYFATHALLPGELTCHSEPALALSPPASPATDRGEDGLLDASEIAALRLNADLVVLSACNTAEGGARFGGEALSGLAESFFYAGARSLLASHWHVPSGATARLMVGLFQRQAAHPDEGIGEALRQSQLSLIGQEETAHPFYWAAFTLIGDGGAKPAPTSADAGQSNPKL